MGGEMPQENFRFQNYGSDTINSLREDTSDCINARTAWRASTDAAGVQAGGWAGTTDTTDVEVDAATEVCASITCLHFNIWNQ